MTSHDEAREELQSILSQFGLGESTVYHLKMDLMDFVEAYANKQKSELLDRIRDSHKGANSGSEAHMMMNDAIQSERAKLEEVKKYEPYE